MGNGASLEAFDPAHIRIYGSIVQIRDPATRAQMIQTCMADTGCVHAAKRAAVYSYLLSYVSAVQSGGSLPRLPGETAGEVAAPPVPRAFQHFSTQGMTNPIVYPATSYGPGGGTAALQQQRDYARPTTTLSVRKEEKSNPYQQITQTPQQKMVSYFSSCLEVLGIQDEVALTEETLKKAYKKIALKAHPDKGGSEEHFEAITRAYAYLSEILKRIQGGRDRPLQEVAAPEKLASGRADEAKAWQHVEPVRLNPKKLDMDAFNKMFEQTHMPDPDSDGYGDWLKSQGGGGAASAGPKFKGEFNRSVFNKMFDEEARKQSRTSNEIIHLNDMALTMAPTMGLEIGRARPDTYTAAPNSKQQYTDLQDAYERESTVSDKVANVRMEERSLESYKANREKGPAPYTDTERAGVAEAERMYAERERNRQQRAAIQSTAEQDYFERMKRLVITNT
jgi:hypothetical protein